MRKTIMCAVLACGLGASPSAGQEAVNLTVGQARSLAQAALAQGELDTALAVSTAIVSERPDAGAYAIQSAALIKLGHFPEGRAAAKRGFALAGDNRALRVETARLAALAATREGKQGIAKFWLRRASDFATPEQGAQLRRDFQAVDRRDKWDRKLSFSIAPSSNINGGADSATMEIDGISGTGLLSGDAQALSGLRSTLSAKLAYELGRTERTRTEVAAQAYATFNTLSDDAVTLAPGAEGSDFNYYVAALDLTHLVVPEGARGPYSFGLGVTKRWYGGHELAHSANVTLGKQTRLERGRALGGYLRYEHEWADSTKALDTDRYTIGTTYGMQLENGGTMTFGLSLTHANAEGESLDYTGQQISLRYTPKGSFGPVNPTFGLDLGHKFYPDHVAGLFVVPGGRRDTSVAVSVDMLVPGMSFMGFSPVVTLRAARTDSNVSRYETTDLSAGLSIRSSF